MKIAKTALAVILGLLGIAAGAAKVMLTPEEAAFLHQFGFTETLMIAFGLIQVFGGLLLVVPRSRAYGASICFVGFAISATLLLIAGNFTLGGASLVPVVLSGIIAYPSFAEQQRR